MPVLSHDTACLLIHGLNGSPYDFDEVAQQLTALGYPATQVLLPGHDVQARVASRYGWSDWVRTVETSFDRLAKQYRQVVVVGHSMGGALGLHLAARDPRVTAIATLCAPVTPPEGLRSIVQVGQYVMPFVPVVFEDIRDPVERRAYQRRKVTSWVSLAPIHTLFRALPTLRSALPRVRCPALVLGARNDHVVSVRDAAYIYAEIGSQDKQLYILNHSWHVVTRDVERHIVLAQLKAFLGRLAPA